MGRDLELFSGHTNKKIGINTEGTPEIKSWDLLIEQIRYGRKKTA